MHILHRHFRSWQTLTAYINSTFSFYNNFIFRGHADAVWKLDSSLNRAFNATGNYSPEQKLQLAHNHLNSFKDNIRGRCTFDIDTALENKLWALGQHFGLHTPLLDWTHSPYVALFFALEPNLVSRKRCLWALSNSFIEEVNSRNTSDQLEILKPLSNDNPRLVSQQGLFLKVPFDKSIEKVIENFKKVPFGVSVFKLTFDTGIRHEALSALNSMNINKLTLFPDLGGSALHANFKLESEPHLTSGRTKMWEKHLNKLMKRLKVHVVKQPNGWKVTMKDFYPDTFLVEGKSNAELTNGIEQYIRDYFKKAGVANTESLKIHLKLDPNPSSRKAMRVVKSKTT